MKRFNLAALFSMVVGIGVGLGIQAERWGWVWSPAIFIARQPSQDTKLEVRSEASEILRVKIRGLRSDKGKVLAVLFSDPENFPDQPKGTPITATAVPQNGEVVLEFPGTSPRPYAVAVIHDEDNDGKMNKGFLGIPTEGFGFSNDAPTFMGPPSYKSCEFQKQPGTFSIEMKMKYM